MTAPLPPLPKFLVALLPHEERAMQSYAKLAVREALERAASTLACHPCAYGDSPAFLRAMIKEYE